MLYYMRHFLISSHSAQIYEHIIVKEVIFMKRSLKNMGNKNNPVTQQPGVGSQDIQGITDVINRYSDNTPDELIGELMNARQSGQINDADMQNFLNTVSPCCPVSSSPKLNEVTSGCIKGNNPSALAYYSIKIRNIADASSISISQKGQGAYDI